MGATSYLDTNMESVFRIREARKHINTALFIIALIFTGIFLVGILSFTINNYITGIYALLLSCINGMLMVGLMVKREIYSIALILKEVKK